VLICYAAVFCRVGTGAFVVLCVLTFFNFVAARSAWSQLDDQPFALGFEGPKLIATLSIIAAGVHRTDLHLRRDFAARELMLMLIEEQAISPIISLHLSTSPLYLPYISLRS
jgi:hypothetical protein